MTRAESWHRVCSFDSWICGNKCNDKRVRTAGTVNSSRSLSQKWNMRWVKVGKITCRLATLIEMKNRLATLCNESKEMSFWHCLQMPHETAREPTHPQFQTNVAWQFNLNPKFGEILDDDDEFIIKCSAPLQRWAGQEVRIATLSGRQSCF